jgi:hypothetical protein
MFMRKHRQQRGVRPVFAMCLFARDYDRNHSPEAEIAP